MGFAGGRNVQKWNMQKTECAEIGMCRKWNVLNLECAENGMYLIWNDLKRDK